jgi:serine protease Do
VISLFKSAGQLKKRLYSADTDVYCCKDGLNDADRQWLKLLTHSVVQTLSRLVFLTILLWAAPLPASMDASSVERVYTLPVAEAEAVITSWLKQNGFHQLPSAVSGQEMRIEAEKQGVHWSIHLQAYSALATRIQVQPVQGRTDPRLAPLWQCLDDYVSTQPRAYEGAARIPAAVRGALDAIVCIYADHDGRRFQLSGFGIDRLGVIVTTAHDLRLEQTVAVHFRDGREMNGRVVALDAHLDLCLVRVPVPLQAIIPTHNGRHMPGEDDTLFVLGCPSSGQDGVRWGALDGPPRRVSGLPLWQVRMDIAPGSSGSPVLDPHGRLAAVVKGRFRGSNTVGFLIPLETLLQFLEKNQR